MKRRSKNIKADKKDIPEFIIRMRENSPTIIFKGKDFAINNK
jgi:hypothetical protein